MIVKLGDGVIEPEDSLLMVDMSLPLVDAPLLVPKVSLLVLAVTSIAFEVGVTGGNCVGEDALFDIETGLSSVEVELSDVESCEVLEFVFELVVVIAGNVEDETVLVMQDSVLVSALVVVVHVNEYIGFPPSVASIG